MNLRSRLDERIRAALQATCGEGGSPALVTPSGRPEFGDYQANGCMAAAKRMKTKPRQLAEKVIENLDLGDLAEKVEIAGPGFINITLKADWLAEQLTRNAADERLGVAKPAQPQTVVVDYSSPNLAKEMHVGHLRSTIIGDALVRTLKFIAGEPNDAREKILPQNHVGDWGTQFGMLIAYGVYKMQEFDQAFPPEVKKTSAVSLLEKNVFLADLEERYKLARKEFEDNPEFTEMSRGFVVSLQQGDSQSRNIWESYLKESLRHCERVYDHLGVLLTPDDVRGESAYNDDLPNVVNALDKAGLLAESEGAKGVFLDEFTNKDNEPAFVIVRKSDGGYLYATTDLAAMRYRVGKLKADRILYVTDSRQALHFQQVFTVARKAGFVPDGVSLEHVGFGMMLGKDNRPLKTREGGTVKLMDLIDEAEARAYELVKAKSAERGEKMDEETLKQVARVVGIGALKYADLSQNRASDYVFSWGKMLSLEGNTAPYMQYAYARIRSIFRKECEKRQGAGEEIRNPKSEIRISEPAERALGVKLLQFPETVEAVADSCQPHLLCGYLFELAGAFMGFYENCPVLQAEGEIRASRLALCDLTARAIATGLGLLGIETVEQM
jgi:arginyl-tRNA synthetase